MKTNKVRLTVLCAIGVLMLIGMLALAAPVANAELKLVNVYYAWDQLDLQYKNALESIYWDGGWEPFLHQVAGPKSNEYDFDDTLFISPTLQASLGGVTLTFNVNTKWAGLMDYAVYHTDVGGAPGFVLTRRWSLAWCDRNGDGVFDTSGGAGSDLKGGNPYDYWNLLKIEDLPTQFIDNVDPAACGGNCQDELVTRLFVSLDKDNDGVVDAAYRVGGVIGGAVRPVCFYAEAKRPYETVPTWTGNPQGRITVGGGDKTVNFHLLGAPTAVTLSSFEASAPNGLAIPEGVVIPGLVLIVLGAIAGLGIWKLSVKRA